MKLTDKAGDKLNKIQNCLYEEFSIVVNDYSAINDLIEHCFNQEGVAFDKYDETCKEIILQSYEKLVNSVYPADYSISGLNDFHHYIAQTNVELCFYSNYENA